MKKPLFQKVLSVVFALTMTLSLLPSAALAASSTAATVYLQI